MRLLTRRDHSVKELRDKLARFYTDESVEHALTQLEDFKLLKAPEELAKLWSESLSRQGKSHRQIQNKLRRLDLPSAHRDADAETKKCRELIERRFARKKGDSTTEFNFDDKAKMHRFLLNRGFDFETIRSVLREFKFLPET